MRSVLWLVMMMLLPALQIPAFAADNAGQVKFENLHKFSEKLAGVSVKGRWGFIDDDGKTVVEPLFHEVRPFHKGYASVKLVNKWGIVDRKGRYVVNPTYDDMGVFSEDLVAVKVDGKWGYINVKDKMVIQPQFSEALQFSSGLAAVRIGSNWGFIDSDGRFAINPRFAGAGTFAEDQAPVQIGAVWGFIDKKGNQTIKPQFQSALSFSDGRAAVQEDTLWGFVNSDGNFETNPQYDSVLSYSEGLAAVQKDGKWGYINRKGKVALPFQYTEADAFSNDIARVVYGGQVMYISPSGKDAGVGVSAKVAAAQTPVTVSQPVAAAVPVPIVIPVAVPKPQMVVATAPKAAAATAPLKAASPPLKAAAPATAAAPADIEPLGTLWKKALVPKHRPIISYMDADENISTFRGADAYFAYSDGSLADGKKGYTDQNGIQVPVTLPVDLKSFGDTKNLMQTTKANLGLSTTDDKKRVFSFAQAAGFAPRTFKMSQTFMGQDLFDNVPIGMLASSYLTKSDEDGTETALWIELAGRSDGAANPITKDTVAQKLTTRIKLGKDAKGDTLPRPYYKYEFNADGSYNLPASNESNKSYLSVGLSHDMVAWDWNDDGYTDYVVSYVANPDGKKDTSGTTDHKSMKVAVVFIDGKSLYNASQGTGTVRFWVNTDSEYTTGADVVGGLTDIKPPNSVRMAAGDLDGDKIPEVALYFTKVCAATSGLAHNNTLSILKITYSATDPATGKTKAPEDVEPKTKWIVSDTKERGKWYLQQDSVALAIGDLDGNGTNELAVLHGNTAALYQPSRVFIDVYSVKKTNKCKEDGTNCKDSYELTSRIDSADIETLKTSMMYQKKDTYPTLQASIADLDGNGTGELIWLGTTEDDSSKLQLNIRSWKKFDPATVNKDNKAVTTLTVDDSKNYPYKLTDYDSTWKLDSNYIRYAMATGRFVYPENSDTGSTAVLRNQIGLVTTATGSDDTTGLRWGIFNWGCDGGPCGPNGKPALTLLGKGKLSNVAKGINVGPSIVAADLDGDSMIIGQGVKTTITDSTETLFNIQAPPKHYDEFTYNGVAYKMDAFSTLKDYKATLNFEKGNTHAKSTTKISNGKFDAKADYNKNNLSSHGHISPPPYFSIGARVAVDWNKDSTDGTEVLKTFELTADSETDDSLLYRRNSHDLWRYPVLYPLSMATRNVKTTDDKTGETTFIPTRFYFQYVVPRKVSDTVPDWGGNVSWYQPRHNNLNLFSYPSTLTDILGYPQGKDSKKADDWWKDINGTTLAKLSNKAIGNLNNGEMIFSLQSDSSTEKNDNYVVTIGGHLNGAPEWGKGEHSVDLEAQSDYSFGTDSVTTTDTSNLMSITVSTPSIAEYDGQSQPKVNASHQSFTVDGSIYTTDSGVYTLGFAVTKLKDNSSNMWGKDSPYQMAADPALNLPRMYTMEDEKWAINTLIDKSTGLDVSKSHEIRGIQFSNAQYFNVTGNYTGQAMPVNTKVTTAVRVYNYSFVKTGKVKVSVKWQPVATLENEPPDVTKAANISEEATINMIPGRGDQGAPNNWQDLAISWTTTPKETYGYFHIVLTTPDTKIEEASGKTMLLDTAGKVMLDKAGKPVYGGGNLNSNNDSGYVLVKIYAPQPK